MPEAPRSLSLSYHQVSLKQNSENMRHRPPGIGSIGENWICEFIVDFAAQIRLKLNRFK